MQLYDKSNRTVERLWPDTYDGFTPPSDVEASRAHLDRLVATVGALVKISHVAKASEPWFRNSALTYVVSIIDDHDGVELPSEIVMRDYAALRGGLVLRGRGDEFAPVEEYGGQDGRKPVQNAGLEWRKRFAWAVVLSASTLRRRKENVSTAAWDSVNRCVLMVGALTSGYHTIEVWRDAVIEARKARHAANVKGGCARAEAFKPYHEKIKELVTKYLKEHPGKDAKDLADGIFGDLYDWIDEECDLSEEPKPTKATLARYLRRSGIVSSGSISKNFMYHLKIKA